MPSRFYKNVIALSQKPEDFKRTQIVDKPNLSVVEAAPTSTVEAEATSTVEVKPATTVEDKSTSTVEAVSTATVEAGPTSMVEAEATSTVEAGPPGIGSWQTENGDHFRSSRVRRIIRAQDALTHIEESVYNFLWGSKTAEPYKLTDAGYAEISRSARIAKRNAPVVVERLIEKGFIRIERQADIWTRRPTQYRVFGYRAALDELDRRGRRWVVKSGNGVLFVRRMEMRVAIDSGSTSTVDAGCTSTVDAGCTSTVDAGCTSTVDAASTMDVDSTSTVDAGSNSPDRSTSCGRLKSAGVLDSATTL